MKKIVLGLVLLLGSQICIGQTAGPLKLGDSVPDIQFKSIIHNKIKSVSLSQLKGKAILLDFWSTWCTPCIALFPELDSLQKVFKEDLVIIAVTRQKREQVETFLKKKPALNNVSFLFATDEEDLLKLFPHGSVPHDVWINKDRRVQAITSDEYLTHANMKAFVNNQTFSFIHKDENLSYNYKKTIEENGLSNTATQALYRSTMYKHIPGLRTTQGLYKTDSSYFLSLLNQPILQLYRYALPVKFSNFHRKTILGVADTNKFVYNERSSSQNFDEWKLDNTFCYEVVSKIPTEDSNIKARMLKDLNAHFNLNGKLEKRMGTVYKLIYNGKGKKPLKSTGKSNAIEWADKGETKNLYNKPITTLIDFLNGATTSRKDVFEFVDETGIEYNVDVELNLGDVGDLEELRMLLGVYWLGVEEEEMEMEVFVLKFK